MFLNFKEGFLEKYMVSSFADLEGPQSNHEADTFL